MKPADIRRLEMEQGNSVTFKQAWRTLKCVRQDLGLEELPPRKQRVEKPRQKKSKKKDVVVGEDQALAEILQAAVEKSN